MKIVYLLKNPGIQSRTPEGWKSVFISANKDGSYDSDSLNELVDADFLVAGLEPIDKGLIACGKQLKLIQRLGVGYDNIDLEAASQSNIPVSNMPDFNAGTVAEHTVMLILSLLRRIFESTLIMKAGKWSPSTIVHRGIFDLKDKTIGILGLGLIGQEVAKRVKPFGVNLIYYDQIRTSTQNERELDVSYRPFEEILKHSDILSIHLPLTQDTFRLLGKKELTKMKSTAILINTARGAIVDEYALAELINNGDIAGAGLDVFSEEPLDPKHPLLRCPNVILTPHTAGQTREAMERMVDMMLNNIQRVMDGEEPLYRVNHL